MKSIAILNHKGGVGKTTVTSCIASSISILEPEAKILLIDADEQSNLKTITGLKAREEVATLASILIDNVDPNKAASKIRDNVDIITSGYRAIRKFNQNVSNLIVNPEKLMRERFKNLEGYDYVFIDCPPALSLVISNIVLYADHVLIPCGPDMLSLMATKATVTFIEEIEKTYGNAAKVLGVLPTLHDSRRNMDLDILDDLERLAASGFIPKCFREIRTDSKIKTSQARRKFIHQSFPKSNAANDFKEATEEMLLEMSIQQRPLGTRVDLSEMRQ